MLVCLEVLADFGTVAIFSVNTFTTTIYKLWTGFFSIHAAQQMASILLLFILCFFFIAEKNKSKRNYMVKDTQLRFRRIVLHGWQKWLMLGFACMLVFFTAVLPLGMLGFWIISGWEEINFGNLMTLFNSFTIAALSGIISVILALLLSFGKFNAAKLVLTKLLNPMLVLGYAIPGSVLAVAVFTFVSFFAQNYFSNTLAVLLFALAVRYTAIFTINIDQALKRIPNQLYDASRSLGRVSVGMYRRVHLPLLLPSIGYTFLIVVIETLKEIPLTLMTRPFGWDTLAVKIYQFTSEGHWEQASYPAALLVILGIIPIYFFAVLINKSNGTARS